MDSGGNLLLENNHANNEKKNRRGGIFCCERGWFNFSPPSRLWEDILATAKNSCWLSCETWKLSLDWIIIIIFPLIMFWSLTYIPGLWAEEEEDRGRGRKHAIIVLQKKEEKGDLNGKNIQLGTENGTLGTLPNQLWKEGGACLWTYTFTELATIFRGTDEYGMES